MATTNPEPDKMRLPLWVLALLPLIALALTIGTFFFSNPVTVFTAEAPPIEDLQAQRVVLDSEGILVTVINNGPDPVTIAQVLVDDAYWNFAVESGSNTLERLNRAHIRVPYPWVEGESHEILIITATGVTFPIEIPVAISTPSADTKQLLAYALLGVYVGIVPVTLGLLWYPVMRRADRRWMNFFLAVTVGLLVFLAVDTVLEALDIAATVPGTFQAQPLVFLATLLTFFGIVAIGSNRRKQDSMLFLSYLIALGIGFHNLGEGLAVGAAFALGNVSLGTFLVVGFTLHNVTEGVGIAAPVAKQRPSLYHFGLLALLAGGPAILGTWLGGFAFDPLLAVVFLSLGAGAILQVVYEVGRLIVRNSQRDNLPSLAWPNVAGLFVGIAIMYFTAFLVA